VISGGTPADAKRLSHGMTELSSRAVDAAAGAFRDGLVDPLLARLTVRGTGNDFADARALLDSLPSVFDEMDEEALVDILAPAIAQAALVGETSVAPNPKDLDKVPELVEPTTSPFEEIKP